MNFTYSLTTMTSELPKKPLRIVVYRPHTEIWFKDTVRQLIGGTLYPHKYQAFFDFLLTTDAEISVSTALCRQKGWKGLVRYLLDPFALLLWIIGNRISFRRVGLVFSKSELRKHDVLFFMHYGNFTYEDAVNAREGDALALALSEVNILKVGHLTHYAYQPVIGASNLKKLGARLFVAENNLLANSNFYQKYFGYLNAKFWCLPFIAADRFQDYTAFRKRSNKLVATGSITFKITDPDFVEFYQTDELQPLRRAIYERAGDYSAELDSMLSDLNASRTTSKGNVGSSVTRVFRRFMKNPQHSYYGKNIVDIYNSYMMFAVPEEVCDLPGIGVVEGMACGCAFFGLDSPMYRDLGMIPGIHYVAHNGTLTDLIEKIRYYQKPEHLDSLELIARNGCKLVNEHFRKEFVYSEFISRLEKHVNFDKQS